ncbi:lanthionine synthetase C family protein [Nocardia brasiliensis]|uniref:lanthionine synthetase C family protein n=3 Tax=Nocardia brasiliensis TaxID=37326 RepID=UPI0018931E50|nr:lanthionine synthetase C family protein [Nocardia brasiliensis]MBF6125382.1 lanthionine synthetase C family protein [Nocardia brasiliensis]
MSTALPQQVSPAERAAELVALVAERLADPAAVATIADRPDNHDPIYGSVMWGPMTLSTGLPGTAMFYAELARRTPSWSSTTHAHVRAAGETMSTQPSRGLYAGPAALLAAVQTCEGHYPELRRKLAAWLADDQLTRLRRLRAQPGPGISWECYDIVNGLSGTARILLDSLDDPVENGAQVRRALYDTLRYLVQISEPITVDGHVVPGWWVPAARQSVAQDRIDYPRGDFNLGLAHGIPGPVAVLSAALRRGHEVPGQRAALTRMAQWLIGWIRTDDQGSYWPCRIPFDDEIATTATEDLFTRTAWCYGAPGVAAAVHHAGQTLDIPEWRAHAVQALHDALARDESRWTLAGPTICHGYAGLLQVVHRIGTAEQDDVLLAAKHRIAATILDMADPAAPFVFRQPMRYPRSAPGPSEFKLLDIAGLLEGAAGVACALLSVLPDDSAETARHPWDRVLALS